MGTFFSSLRYLNWGHRRYHKLELREVPMMGSQWVIVMANLRGTKWEKHWDNQLELGEVPLMGY